MSGQWDILLDSHFPNGSIISLFLTSTALTQARNHLSPEWFSGLLPLSATQWLEWSHYCVPQDTSLLHSKHQILLFTKARVFTVTYRALPGSDLLFSLNSPNSLPCPSITLSRPNSCFANMSRILLPQGLYLGCLSGLENSSLNNYKTTTTSYSHFPT